MPQYRDASTSKKRVDLAGHIIMKRKAGLFRKGKITLIVNQYFLDYLETVDESTKKRLLEELSQQAIERFKMLNEPDNPFYGDENGFEHYRSVKYKLLYKHIDKLLKIAWGQE